MRSQNTFLFFLILSVTSQVFAAISVTYTKTRVLRASWNPDFGSVKNERYTFIKSIRNAGDGKPSVGQVNSFVPLGQPVRL